MKFLLVAVNAKYIHSNPAIYSLRAYAGEALREHIELAEYTINQSVQDILADIYSRRPEVIGLSCYIWNWRMIQELLRELPKLLPDTDIWLGGPEVSYDGEAVLSTYPQVTGIMVGEGEATFKELLEYYLITEGCGESGAERKDSKLQNIAGLYLPNGYTPVREPVDMSSIPFLYEDLSLFENRIIYYESSRGCPFRCSYCLSSVDKKLRFRDLSIVKRELQFFLDQGVKQVKFVDRTFNCNREHAMAIWQYILENDNSVTNFHFEISADILGEEELALLERMRPGLVQLEIGVQTANGDTLTAIRRFMDIEKLEHVVERLRRAQNVHLHLDLIAGLPYEDYESFGVSFDRVYAMEPEQLQLGFLKVLKGSAMEEESVAYGLVYQDMPPYEVLYTKWLTYGEVLRLKRVEEMVELYYNSNQFVYTLKFLEQAFETPFRMYEQLAAFYERKGYFKNSPARSYRYQVLLEFATEYDKQYEAVYRELLTYDMYLRENLKSRPEFAKDLSVYKDIFRAFYKQEEDQRKYLPAYEAYDAKQLSRMTHLEAFHYPVWEKLDRNMTLVSTNRAAENGPYFVLFDYQKRSPLTGEARTVVVDEIPLTAE